MVDVFEHLAVEFSSEFFRGVDIDSGVHEIELFFENAV